MKITGPMKKRLALLLTTFLISAGLFSASPQLVWHQVYGTPTDSQQVFVMAVDNYDNLFLAGVVNLNGYGNVIVNRYDGVGNLMWNRLYNNDQPAANADKPVALFPDNQAGVTVIAYINKQAVLTHIFSYDANGNIQADHLIGDTTTGKKTQPLMVISDAVSFYMLGQLNSVSSIFKCDNSGHVIWSTPISNGYNTKVGTISFDPSGNIVAGVYDSILPQVIIHRYNSNTGVELPGFNTHVNRLPVNDNFIKVLVDPGNNIFLAATAIDSLGRTQLVVNKFDTAGNQLYTTTCASNKGHSNMVNSFLLDHGNDILISGPYSDNTDSFQYAGLYKVSGSDGSILWSAIDSEFLVNAAVTVVDYYNNVYLGTTKTPSTISPLYSTFSFSQLSNDSGLVQWNRSFDNTSDNTGLLVHVNNFGDLFFASTTPTDSSSGWFTGRIGNAAGDVQNTAVKTITTDNNLSIFPNPFSTETNIRFTDLIAETLNLKICDLTGSVLQQREIHAIAGQNLQVLNTSLSSGVYLLRLEGANSSSTQRIVVY